MTRTCTSLTRLRPALALLAPVSIATVLIATVLLASAPAYGQARYGEVTVEQGSLLLVRGERRFEYAAGDPAVVVAYDDVITVRPNSRAVMRTVENVELTFGGNTVFQAKPFARQEQRGVLRVLFGRLRAKIVALSSGQQFSMKTSQGVIGVKGTEFFTTVTSQGDTLVAVSETEHEVTLVGLQGPPQELKQDLVAVVLNSQAVSQAAELTVELRREIAVQELEAPAAFAPEARDLPAEAALVRAGIVSPADLVQAKRERVSLEDVIPFEERAEPLELRYEIDPQSSGDALRRNLLLSPRP